MSPAPAIDLIPAVVDLNLYAGDGANLRVTVATPGSSDCARASDQ